MLYGVVLWSYKAFTTAQVYCVLASSKTPQPCFPVPTHEHVKFSACGDLARALQINIKARIKAMWQKSPLNSRIRRKPQQQRPYREQDTANKTANNDKEKNQVIMYLHTQLDDFQCQHRLASFHIQNQISHLSNRHIPNHYSLSDFLRVSQQRLALGEI